MPFKRSRRQLHYDIAQLAATEDNTRSNLRILFQPYGAHALCCLKISRLLHLELSPLQDDEEHRNRKCTCWLQAIIPTLPSPSLLLFVEVPHCLHRSFREECRRVTCIPYRIQLLLCGPGVTVELGEANFGKKKYNRGSYREVCVSLKKIWVPPGSVIFSDGWSSYSSRT